MTSVSDPVENRWELAALIVFLSVGAVAITSMAGLDPIAGLLSVLGFAVALPLALIFGDRLIESAGAPSEGDPLAELRARYARGEISHEEFERRVDRLLETEDVAVSEADAREVREIERERE